MRHLTYANVAATLALIFSMSGGALAASHYLITSRSQVKPAVLRTLHGPPGPEGPRGFPGTNGTGAILDEAKLTKLCVAIQTQSILLVEATTLKRVLEEIERNGCS
jgi:hypothetical protein